VTVERRRLGYSGIARNFVLCEKSMAESVAILPQVWKIHRQYEIPWCETVSVNNVPELSE